MSPHAADDPDDPRLVPVVKSLFTGQIPEDTVFPYPEIDPSEAETVAAFLDSFRSFTRDHFDAARSDREHLIPPSVVAGLALLLAPTIATARWSAGALSAVSISPRPRMRCVPPPRSMGTSISRPARANRRSASA